jgi:hypothetical protein
MAIATRTVAEWREDSQGSDDGSGSSSTVVLDRLGRQLTLRHLPSLGVFGDGNPGPNPEVIASFIRSARRDNRVQQFRDAVPNIFPR